MLHFVTSYMKQNKSRKQALEIAQYGLEISFYVGSHKRSNQPNLKFKTMIVQSLLQGCYKAVYFKQ